MKNTTLFATIISLALLSSTLWAATVTRSFDSVSSVNILNNPVGMVIITGIEKDTGNPLIVEIHGKLSGLATFRPEVQRCIPPFLMAMDKPGRYFLHITIDDAAASLFYGCNLEVKN